MNDVFGNIGFTLVWGVGLVISHWYVGIKWWMPIERQMDPSFWQKLLIAFWPSTGWMEAEWPDSLRAQVRQFQLRWFLIVLVFYFILPAVGRHMFPVFQLPLKPAGMEVPAQVSQ